ncbi:MAG: exonuclease subunit SbcD [Chloroflexota bacterium]|nr:MAG: exonuclease subunit SbcD [Chloroflexota bacterium]
MKLMHTSDLHLGSVWRGKSRQKDEQRVLAEVLSLCDQHNVDILLVAGDVFADRVEGNHAQVARRFLEQLRTHLQRGRVVFLLRGNHDPLDLFQLMRLLVSEMAGGSQWPLMVADLPGIYRVFDQRLQIVALPYIGPRWLREQPREVEAEPEEQMAGLSGLLAYYVEQLYRKATPGIPSVFTGHMLLTGAQLRPDLAFETGYDRELWLQPSRLPQFTSYNAMGHLHLTQEIAGAGKPTWYSGAPDRWDLGERDYTPQVLLVEVPTSPGGVATVEPLALSTCTPFVRQTLDGVDAVDNFCSTVTAIDPLGELEIAGVPVASRGAVEAQIRRSAPRLLIRWAFDAEPLAPQYEAWLDPGDVPGTVTRYLQSAYSEQPAKLTRLASAFETLWSETSEARQ